MNVDTMVRAYPGLDAARAGQLVEGCNKAMAQAQVSTLRRAAMWVAQTGEESGSLRYSEEIATGTEYEGRADLGNTQPGDGVRFKGRGFIQITGRLNYTSLSGWANSRGYVPTPTYFVDHPEQLATDAYVWLGVVWYWTVARPNLNQLADAGDVITATREINGGLNGIDDRTNRWNNALNLGNALLPIGNIAAVLEDDEMKPYVIEQTDGDRAFWYGSVLDGFIHCPRPAAGQVGMHQILASADGVPSVPREKYSGERITYLINASKGKKP